MLCRARVGVDISGPSTAREAFIVETLGEVAALLDRVDAVVPALDASRLSLINASTELAGQVTAFESRMAGITENAKVQAVKHIARRTDEMARSSLDAQTRAMVRAASSCSGSRCCQWSSNNPQRWSSNFPHPSTPRSERWKRKFERPSSRTRVAYLWGTFQDEQGEIYCPMRRIPAALATDAKDTRRRFYLCSPLGHDDGMHMHPIGKDSVRNDGFSRTLEDDVIHWRSHPAQPGNRFHVTWSPETCSWFEEGAMDIRGWQRVGDTREPDVWFAWGEAAPEHGSRPTHRLPDAGTRINVDFRKYWRWTAPNRRLCTEDRQR
jgi:hypothetical protein